MILWRRWQGPSLNCPRGGEEKRQERDAAANYKIESLPLAPILLILVYFFLFILFLSPSVVKQLPNLCVKSFCLSHYTEPLQAPLVEGQQQQKPSGLIALSSIGPEESRQSCFKSGKTNWSFLLLATQRHRLASLNSAAPDTMNLTKLHPILSRTQPPPPHHTHYAKSPCLLTSPSFKIRRTANPASCAVISQTKFDG